MDRTHTLLLGSGIKSDTSLSRILIVATLSLNIRLGNWRLRNLLQLCIKDSASASQTLARILVSVFDARPLLQLDISCNLFKIDPREFTSGEIQLVLPLKKRFG